MKAQLKIRLVDTATGEVFQEDGWEYHFVVLHHDPAADAVWIANNDQEYTGYNQEAVYRRHATGTGMWDLVMGSQRNQFPEIVRIEEVKADRPVILVITMTDGSARQVMFVTSDEVPVISYEDLADFHVDLDAVEKIEYRKDDGTLDQVEYER